MTPQPLSSPHLLMKALAKITFRKSGLYANNKQRFDELDSRVAGRSLRSYLRSGQTRKVTVGVTFIIYKQAGK